MFKRGDYIVILKKTEHMPSHPLFYCFKQRISDRGLKAELDIKGSTNNGIFFIGFDKKDRWRWATHQEKAVYDLIGKPYNTKMLENEEILKTCIKLGRLKRRKDKRIKKNKYHAKQKQ